MRHLVEVGCIGSSSWHEFLSADARLDIIEPIPKNIAAIEGRYKGYSNVFVHPYAVWKEPGTIKMYNLERVSYVDGVASPAIGTYNGMASPTEVAKTLSYEPKEEDLIEVEAITFDQFDPGTIDMLDLDVEGCEWYILQVMVSRPKIICVETGVDRNHPFMEEIDGWAKENRYVEFRHYDSNSWFKRLP